MKVHLTLGHERSLCGMHPRNGSYDIRTHATFFHAPEQDQCSRCLHHFEQRGNSIKKARAATKFQPVPRALVLADRAGVPC
jgi:hypothetical protein